MEALVLSFSGIVFHSLGAATANALSPLSLSRIRSALSGFPSQHSLITAVKIVTVREGRTLRRHVMIIFNNLSVIPLSSLFSSISCLNDVRGNNFCTFQIATYMYSKTFPRTISFLAVRRALLRPFGIFNSSSTPIIFVFRSFTTETFEKPRNSLAI